MGMVRILQAHNIPVTRENYLWVECAGDPQEWSAELEAQLPPGRLGNRAAQFFAARAAANRNRTAEKLAKTR